MTKRIRAELLSNIVLAVLFLISYFSSGNIFFSSVIAGMFAAFFPAKDEKVSALLPFFIALLYLSFVYLVFIHFKQSNSAAAIAGFAASVPILLASLYIIGGKKAIAVINEWVPPVCMNDYLRVAFAVIAGVFGWFALKNSLVITSFILYVLSFIMMLGTFANNSKTDLITCAGSTMPRDGTGDKIRVFILFLMTALLAYKTYMALYSYSYMNAVLTGTAALFFAALILKEFKVFEKENGIIAMKTFDWGVLALIVTSAAIIRLVNLDMMGTWYDESITLTMAQVMKINAVFYASPTAFSASLPTWLTKYILSVLTSGEVSMITVRLISVFSGVIEIVFVFLLVRELYGRRPAIISGIVLSVLFTHILYSRQGVAVGLSSMAVVMFLYFLVMSLKRGAGIYWIMTGLSIGLGYYFYNASKFLLHLALFILFILFFFTQAKKSYLTSISRGLVLLFAALLVTYFPLMEYFMKNPGTFWGRMSYVYDMNIVGSMDKVITAFAVKAAWVYSSFFTHDSSLTSTFGLPSAPIINAINAFWFFLGTVFLFAGWRSKANMIVLGWFFFGASMAIFANQGSGDFTNRTIVAYSAVAVIAALGIEAALRQIDRLGKNISIVTVPAAAGMLLLFFVYSGIHDYFSVYASDPAVGLRQNNTYIRLADDINKTGAKRTISSSSFKRLGHGEILGMKGIKADYRDLRRVDFEHIYGDAAENTVISADARLYRHIEILKDYYPEASIETRYFQYHWMFNDYKPYMNLYGWNNPAAVIDYWIRGKPMTAFDYDSNTKPYIEYINCYIPKEDILNLSGLNAVFYQQGKEKASERVLHEFSVPVEADSAILKGAVYAPISGVYAFTVKGGILKSLKTPYSKLNGQKIQLIEGEQPVEIVIGSIFNDKIEILWEMPGDKNMTAVPAGCFLSKTSPKGLLRTTYYESVEYKSRDYNLINRNYWHSPEIDPSQFGQPISRKWNGKLVIGISGNYEFDMRYYNDCSMRLAGTVVFSQKANKTERRKIYLAKGNHDFEVYVLGPFEAQRYTSMFAGIKGPGMKDFREIDHTMTVVGW